MGLFLLLLMFISVFYLVDIVGIDLLNIKRWQVIIVLITMSFISVGSIIAYIALII